MNTQIEEILNHFQPITLAQMDNVQLMNRTDTKFIFNTNQLTSFLVDLSSTYKTLVIANTRQSRYETLYYDTDQFYHYLQHQNGKKHRYKIRKREYLESAISFLEVKEKSNKGRTNKSRVRLLEMVPTIDESDIQFISKNSENPNILVPKLWNSYTRTTLVDLIGGERVTLDSDLAFYYDNKRIELNGFVIAEVKQNGENRHSLFMQQMKQRLFRPDGISKYCLGVALLYPQIKSNIFKEKILRINKIIKDYAN